MCGLDFVSRKLLREEYVSVFFTAGSESFFLFLVAGQRSRFSLSWSCYSSHCVETMIAIRATRIDGCRRWIWKLGRSDYITSKNNEDVTFCVFPPSLRTPSCPDLTDSYIQLTLHNCFSINFLLLYNIIFFLLPPRDVD